MSSLWYRSPAAQRNEAPITSWGQKLQSLIQENMEPNNDYDLIAREDIVLC